MNIRNWITSFGSGRIHNMDNDFGSFNMPEKFMSQTDTIGSTFNQSRNIRNDETTGSFQIHYTQIRIQGREMIVGNLGSGIGHSGQERGFTNIGKSYQSDISDHLQFQQKFQFLCSLSRLCILGCLHGTGSIMLVAVTALAAF